MTTSIKHDRAVGPGTDVFPASFLQEELWSTAQDETKQSASTSFIAIRLKQELDEDILGRSLDAIVQRHETLRTTFRHLGGRLEQVIAPNLTLPLLAIDLRGLHAAEREAEATRLMTEETKRPFDLMSGPLLRASLLHLKKDEHMLLLTAHPLIADPWSMGVLCRELAALYEAFAAGQPSPLPELPIQYKDFVVQQRAALQGDDFAEYLTYWKQELEGAPGLLELPTDHPRLPVSTSQGSAYYVTLPSSLIDALKELSRREGVTLPVVLVAAFQTLLSRYSGQDDVVIGTVMPGRTQEVTESLIGAFANMLALRSDLSGNPSFRTLLARVRDGVLGVQAHQDLPFEHLFKELHLQQLDQNQPFQVVLSFDPPLPSLPAGWEPFKTDVETGTARFDLSLELADRPWGLVSRFEYSTDLFDAPAIARMAGHWQTLLEGIVADPAQDIATLPLLTEAERHQLLVDWNATQESYPREKCLHQMFEAQVERTPDAVAVVFGEEHLTYRELNARANQLASHLRQLGVGPEVLVGICMERSLEMVSGLLGILKAGGAYVPLDPAYPQDRRAFMLQDSQVAVLLTQQRLVEGLPQHEAKVICLDTEWRTIAQECDENPISGATSENLAYVIYTSGSTGRPKGVAIEHRSTIAFVQWAKSVFTPEDLAGVLASTSICFDLSVFEIFVTLSSGGTVILAENLLQLPDLSTDLRVTLINTVPSVMAELLYSASLPASVHTVNLAGEPLHSALVRRLYQQDTIQRVFNLYGPTEDTTYSTYMLAEKGEWEPSIGRPIANTQVYILDSLLQPVPIGVAGELYIGGDGLARGYLNRPDLTAERFIQNPFSDAPDARLYKTGDLARYRPDGNIEYLGRLDHQVKIRGFRIELGEIGAVLEHHPAVREAVVVVREDAPGNKRLVAYIVLHKDQSATVDDLKSHVMKQVPAYMVPSAFVLLEALPLTPNGKVDRRALPAPEPIRSAANDTYVAPTLAIHYQLAQIWEDLLDVRPIGIKDDFFDLGGHSLLAIRLFDRIAQSWGKKLPYSTIFAGATIEQLASALTGEVQIDTEAPLLAVQTGGSRRPFFYLHGQWEEEKTFHCYPLARALGPEQPFYALKPHPLNGQKDLPTLEEIAAAHIETIRAVQPEGPYLLGGWCNGGLIVYEMARQLEREGQVVDLLALLDPERLVYPITYRFYRKAFQGVGKLLRVGQTKPLAWSLRLKHLIRSLRYTLRRKEDPDPVTEGELLQNYPRLFDWVASGYRPLTQYDGKVTFFWTYGDEKERIERSSRKSWRDIEAKGKSEVHLIPGDHLTSRTTYLHVLAEHLDRCIRQSQH